MARVSLNNVVKRYGSVQVVHGVSFDIDDGEFLILVGPSGCGKSTLLRMVAGLEDVNEGEIAINDAIVNEMEPKERDIAMVFQNYALYPHMSVAKNMGYSLKLSGVPLEERNRRVHEAAEILDLTELLDRLPKQLSGGQRQRVAMGRAIVRDPKVFLFDEPLSNLDAKLRVAMRGEIKTLHQKLRTTIIYVTHDQIEAMTMADRIVVMNQGRVEQIGTPLELYDRPDNLFVASFIGSPAMNFFDGELKKTPNGMVAELAGGLALRVENIGAEVHGKQVVIGVRPEHFEVTDTKEGALDATVVVVEPTGSETQVSLERYGQTFVAVFRDRIDAKAQTPLLVRPNLSELHIFDKQTQQRIA